MKVSLCTITFRHHLLSLKEIATFARANDFQGVELWGVHARNLEASPIHGAEWLASFGLEAPMISDYLPVEGDEADLRGRAAALCRLARRWGATRVRTFAGARGSRETGLDERRRITDRLRLICAIAADHGVDLVAETHPATLADALASTVRLIDEVDHDAFGINFDVLHVWEGGDDPLEARRVLAPRIRHYHLKNVRSRVDLGVFAPANVYAAAGRRDGMTPLLDGAYDFAPLLSELVDEPGAQASLEWFGGDCFGVLASDREAIRRIEARRRAPLRRTGT